MNIETKAVHSGERKERQQHRSVVTPIEQTAAYYFEDTQQIIDFYEGRLSGIKYGRYGCPTQHAVERKIADLETTDRSLLFSSGMAAVTTAILALVKKGQHILFTNDCYRNTKKFFTDFLPNLGIESTEVNIDNLRNLENYVKNNTVLFFSELPTNPFLRVIDLEKIAEVTQKRGLTFIVDSTFATPINIRPVDYGADIILHSATKYLGGHHDLFAGVVAGKQEYLEIIQQSRDVLGGIIDPHTSFLLLRSIQTLPIRMKVHNENAQMIAEWLERHQEVESVWYPGLNSHPDYELAKKYMAGFGGVITFRLRANEKETSSFVDSLRLPYIATNFGGPQSLIEQHAVLTFYKDRENAEKRGITENLIRYAVGFESVEDVFEDFNNAFKVLRR
ncbi:MAG: aminotransferase class I/II-fold pyridoxal phosphate-dependent enzyme [Nanoarchaeota archaeon]|nr:aminotransferase class I/II-fold pyridoxal phosphate-dependent enzyme [Nanoarchaeota archaeon]MBU1854753.1 aminotransferase class I/II-fold pyridoxal phosphate-dependent enzyme [Nanoarchaeota archaeon]